MSDRPIADNGPADYRPAPDTFSVAEHIPIADNIAALRRDVAAALQIAERPPDAVRICAVSKKQSPEAVRAAVDAGITDIGESYVQEAIAKLAGMTDITRHFIGHIQTNKAKAIVGNFDLVHAVDREDAGVAIARAQQSLGRGVRVLVQVNISPTERFGMSPAEAIALAQKLRGIDLDVDGVMAIGPNTTDRDAILRSFEEAARCFSEIGGSTFSIGMSGDWREAVTCGATLIRIGSAIFGPRSPLPGAI